MIQKITQEEKDKWTEDLLNLLRKLGEISNSVSQASAMFTQVPAFIETVFNAGLTRGQREGFIEGYKKAMQGYEKKLSKLN